MDALLIRKAEIYQHHRFSRGDLLIKEGKILKIAPHIDAKEGTPVLEAQGHKLVPGFIDVHTHGGFGHDVNASDVQDLEKIAAFFASQGTTSFNASVLTDTEEKTLWCIDQLKAFAKEEPKGAELLGIHLEGPFLSKEYKGAMPEVLLKEGDPELLLKFQQASEGWISYVTVAPEVPGVADMIDALAKDTNFAIGHSAASYEESWDAIRKGARSSTHTFNAMKLFHQHFPAIMGAALESDIFCEAICDGRHLHPGTVRMLLKCKGPERVVAITDSIMAAGLPDGEYKLGVNDVIVKDGDAKLPNGVRAGSTLTMGQALRNLIKFTGRSLEEILPLLTENPAELMRVGLQEHLDQGYAKDRRKGYLLPGFDGDMVLLDEQNDILCTIVHGNIVFKKAQ